MVTPWTPRERALYEALEATPCRCSKAIKNACPTCGETLVAVRYSGYLNSDQWDAIKGGDWYCNTCTDPSIVNGKKHWHDRELETITYQQCSRCTALADPPPPDTRDAALRLAEAELLRLWKLVPAGRAGVGGVRTIELEDDEVARLRQIVDAIRAAKGGA